MNILKNFLQNVQLFGDLIKRHRINCHVDIFCDYIWREDRAKLCSPDNEDEA